MLGDFVPGDGPLPEEQVEDSLRSQILAAALEALAERERQVLVLRYGLEDAEPKTLEEIGRRLGLTRERVRQIEVEALKRLVVPARDAGRRGRARQLGGAGCSALQVQLQPRRDRAQLAQRARLELADALPRDAEPRPHLLERLRVLAVEAEAQREHVAHARVEARQRRRELASSGALSPSARSGRRTRSILDQVAVARLAVADGRLEADRILDEARELLDRALG